MTRQKRIATAIIGVALFLILYRLFFNSGFLFGYFEPAVESGQLGSNTASFWMNALETASAFASTAFFMFLLNAARALNWASELVHDLTGKYLDHAESNADSGMRNAESSKATPAQTQPVIDISDKRLAIEMMIQGAIDGNSDVVITMAEQIHGDQFFEEPEA